jgi:hypothetical protein
MVINVNVIESNAGNVAYHENQPENMKKTDCQISADERGNEES